MSDFFTEDAAVAVAVEIIPSSSFDDWLADQPENLANWARSTGFKGKAGTLSMLPDETGGLAKVLFAVADEPGLWDWAKLPAGLPAGRYRVDGDHGGEAATSLALAWALDAYAFKRYKRDAEPSAEKLLVWPDGCDRDAVVAAAAATGLVRDLINTPASDMGPDGLAAAAEDLARDHGAEITVVVGDDLLERNFPAVHAVGRAHDRAPRLIDLRWGDPAAPKVTLVGKGVCFDTGGLDIKSAAGMKLMKKDMGGGAHVLGVAKMVMAAALPVRLRVLVPAVENSIAGNAMRPGDIVATRKGLSIEINNTDAEGRVILADALTEAAAETPDLIVDFATLTGAARVALGTDLPALYCNDEALAADILGAAEASDDPLWRMPLWAGYEEKVDAKVGDVDNAPEGGYGGSITAALFLQRFVADGVPWAHLDLMAWNLSTRAGRPEGGEAMGMRAVYQMLRNRYGG